MEDHYQICTRCVMDTTDPDIVFDEKGICNHCHSYDRVIETSVVTGERGIQRLNNIAGEIRRKGKGRKYDCVLGVSGGVDSSFTALKAKELGLRPLVIHLDNGWDSELAVKNVENICNKLGMDLFTWVLDWEEFRDLQLAFLKASTPDSEIPTDHAILGAVCRTAKRYGIKYIIRGCNARTESHLPKAWSQGHWDWRYIRNIHKRFGTVKLRRFPGVSFARLLYYGRTMRTIDVLNCVDYRKTDAIPILEDRIGWKYYGGKHYESIYTRFYQGYILPVKFGFDKRKTHLSSLVCSGEITREQALDELKKDTYPVELQEDDKVYVIKKLGLTESEFENIMRLPKKTYHDYPNHEHIYESPLWKTLRRAYRGIHSR
jgi:N-acetyl sugar amidotransferase